MIPLGLIIDHADAHIENSVLWWINILKRKISLHNNVKKYTYGFDVLMPDQYYHHKYDNIIFDTISVLR